MEEHASLSGTKRERYILRSVAKNSEPFHATRLQRSFLWDMNKIRAENFQDTKKKLLKTIIYNLNIR